MKNTATGQFYRNIKPFPDFDGITDPDYYHSLPEDWIIGVADITDSTGAIEAGLYKTINTIGAAIISAQLNIPDDEIFPYVFGGDGAGFAIPPRRKTAAALALSAVKRWAHEEFDMELRVALVPVKEIRFAGFDVAVARYQASKGVDYAMFRGGGLVWAEEQMKKGTFQLKMAPEGTFPDLEGLSCRWTPLVPKRGLVLSILAIARKGSPAEDYQMVIQELMQLVHHLERDGHPVPPDGPMTSWQPAGVKLEAHATRGEQSYISRLVELRIRTFIAWLFFITNTSKGDFDPTRYRHEVSSNSDFRKYDDGLKMTLDCDPETAGEIETLLEKASRDRIVHYGIFRQSEAMMTCFVPSVARDDHVHFIDGASGGYARAAIMLKKSIKGD